MDVQSLLLILGALAVIGGCVFMLLELRSRTLRTRVVDVPGTLRFEAHTFSVEVKVSTQQIQVHVNKGRLTRHPLQGGSDEVQEGPLDVTLPAPGLTIAVAPADKTPRNGQDKRPTTGLYSITIRASDAMISATQKLPSRFESVVDITPVPESVAQSFETFSNRVHIWADKLERRLKADLAERTRQEEDAAQLEQETKWRAEGDAKQAAKSALESSQELANDQVARWRKAAGFRGIHSEVSIDADGRVHWFVDLTDDGRITLHANKRTIHTTLLGASFLPEKMDLVILVRDDYWTAEDPALKSFRVFDGLPPDGRRLWKDRLEAARNKLDKAAKLGEIRLN
jgi:hypothetical protein